MKLLSCIFLLGLVSLNSARQYAFLEPQPVLIQAVTTEELDSFNARLDTLQQKINSLSSSSDCAEPKIVAGRTSSSDWIVYNG